HTVGRPIHRTHNNGLDGTSAIKFRFLFVWPNSCCAGRLRTCWFDERFEFYRRTPMQWNYLGGICGHFGGYTNNKKLRVIWRSTNRSSLRDLWKTAVLSPIAGLPPSLARVFVLAVLYA